MEVRRGQQSRVRVYYGTFPHFVAQKLGGPSVMLIRILIWCALGYAGGWIAARKGYPPKLGVVVGVLFGPLGLIVGALLPRTKEGREQAELEREMAEEAAEFNQRQKCPSCGREISARARVCGLCGHRLV